MDVAQESLPRQVPAAIGPGGASMGPRARPGLHNRPAYAGGQRRLRMRIGMALVEPKGPDPFVRLNVQLQHAADDGFASAWMSQLFGLDALTALAVAGSRVPGIELGTAVVPTYPRHPAFLAQQALTVAAATGGRLTLG